MTIIQVIQKLRDDLKLWVTNNLNVKMDKNLGADNVGKVLTVDEEGNIIPMENARDCAFTDYYKEAVDNYVIEVDLNGADDGNGTEDWQGYFDVDDTLSLVGVAADAKKTGDELARLNEMLGGSSVSDQIADALVEVYVQNIEPVDAPEGSIWVDTGTPGLDDTEDTTAKVYLIDAGTSDISSIDLSNYKVGDVIIVTTS